MHEEILAINFYFSNIDAFSRQCDSYEIEAIGRMTNQQHTVGNISIIATPRF